MFHFSWKVVGDTDSEGNCWNAESIKDPETGEDLPDRILKYYYAVLIEKSKANIINGNLVLPNNRIEKVLKSDEFVLEKTKGFDEEYGTWVITSTVVSNFNILYESIKHSYLQNKLLAQQIFISARLQPMAAL